MIEGCIQGGFNVRNLQHDENSILSDFSSNINIIIDGKQTTQDQILAESYYKNFNNYNNTQINNKQKKFVDISDDQKPLEPGQVDPSSFFSNSGFYDLFK